MSSKIVVLEYPSLQSLAWFPTWEYCLSCFVWWMFLLRRPGRRSHARFHFVIDLAQLIDCPKEISSSNSCQVQAFQYHLRASSWHFTDLVVLPGDRRKKVCTLHEVGELSSAPIRKSVQHSFELDTACRSFKLWCLWNFSFWFWHLCLWWSASRTICDSPSQFCYLLVLPVEYIQDFLDHVVTLGLPIRLAFAVLPTFSACSELFLPLFVSSTYTDKNNCNLRWRKGTPMLLWPCSNSTSSNFLSHKNPANGWS